jgi:tetratricopeptide (TPR) repeat protein
MMRRILLILIAFACSNIYSQEWSLKLKSTVQLRTWKLTSRADKDERSCEGANIQLIQDNKIIKEIMSDKDGNFVIDIPGNGIFYINISYPGCNGKKFYVSTKNVSSYAAGNNFKPAVTIGGFMMAKPFSGIDYIGLQEPLLAVEYKNNEFDKDQTVSNKGVQIIENIMDAEVRLIDKFCFQTKLGDEALNKKNYKLAKQYYTKALELIPNEEYPKFKLEKAEDGIKEEEAKEQALKAEQAAQIEAQKIAMQKKIEEKKQKENASFNLNNKTAVENKTISPVQDSIVTSKASEEKAKADALAATKAEEERVARAKAEAEIAEKQKAQAEAEALAKKKAVEEAKAKVALSATTNSTSVNTTSVNTPIQNTTQTGSANNTTSITSTPSEVNSSSLDLPVATGVKGKAKRKIKHQIGSSYHEDISIADAFFKENKYKEAKEAYAQALKEKPHDHYATIRVSECNKRLKK